MEVVGEKERSPVKKGSRKWEGKDIGERLANRGEVVYERGRSLVIGGGRW